MKTKDLRFHKENFSSLCDSLLRKDPHLKGIVRQYGYPPMWTRPANFPTLIHIILEQQVSLASAKAAFTKLKQKLVTITPEKLLLLNDEEMKACYFSRQKTGYARHLAAAIVSKQLNLKNLSFLPDEKNTGRIKKNQRHWRLDSGCLFVICLTENRYFSSVPLSSNWHQLPVRPVSGWLSMY